MTTLAGGKLYFKLKNKKINNSRDIKVLQYNQSTNWRDIEFKFNDIEGKAKSLIANNMSLLRKKASPIEVIGLPSYEKLSDDERALCSIARILPASYLEYKKLLITENTKIGYLRLADARRLIKIDVNKTRQIYDFLLRCGTINNSQS